MPGVLNRVSEAARRLSDRGNFHIPDCCVELAERYRIEFDTAKEFCKTCITLSEKDFSAAIDVYTVYRSWCIDRGGKPVGYHNFWTTFNAVWRKEIDSHVIYRTKGSHYDRIKKTSTRARGWSGIRWFNADYETVEEEESIQDVPVQVVPVKVVPVKKVPEITDPVIETKKKTKSEILSCDSGKLTEAELEELQVILHGYEEIAQDG